MKAEEKLKEIRELVDQQAEDFLLWYIPLDLKQTRQEIHLQNELRKLHALIEE